jgi:hypothetical protein
MKMKKALVLMLIGLSVAGCTQTERGASIGAASGAIIGGIATGNVRGAAVGAAIGGVAGAVIGRVSEQPGQCYYRDRYGNRYIAREATKGARRNRDRAGRQHSPPFFVTAQKGGMRKGAFTPKLSPGWGTPDRSR